MILCFVLFMAAVIACLTMGRSLVWAILWGLGVFFVLGLRRGYSVRQLTAMAWKKGRSALVVVPVFLLIGMVTGLWRSGGTISFFLYHGLKGIDPTWFVLMAFLLSTALNYDHYSERLDARYAHFEAEYGVTRNLTQAQVDAMTPDQLANLEAASKAISEDEEALYVYNMMIQLMIVITSFSILLAYIVLEFTVPMALGNGQTIGKKVFGIGVMRQDGVRVNGVCMFIRTVLGKFAIETMIPAMMLIMLFFGAIGFPGVLIGGGIVLVELVLLLTTRERCMIHDKLASTVTVDLASQMIFDTQEDLIAYKQKVAAEKAARESY